MGNENVTGGVWDDSGAPFGLVSAHQHEYAVFTLDADGVVSSWNPGAERIKGYRAEEIIGKHVSLFYPPDDVADGVPERNLTAAAETGTHVAEGWRVRKDGSWFWAHVVITALRRTDGTLRGYARVTRDDTESRVRLDRSIQQFTDLFGLTPVGVGLFDAGGHVLDANPALCDLLGYSQEQLVGMPAVALFRADEHSGDLFPDAPESQPPQVREQVLVRSDGQLVHCDLHVARSVREAGDRFWLVVFQDVTQLHRQTETLRYRATHDELTGLPNRSLVGELLEDMGSGRYALLHCDIDNFKRVNDALGSVAGGELLVALAKRLQAGLPEHWSVLRVPGDEYLVICPDVESAGGVEAVASAVSGLLRTTVPLRGQLVRVSASIGVAVAGDTGTGGEDLARFASAAVHEAKDSGPEHVSLAGPALVDAVDRQLHMEQQLREAIDHDELVLHYQPTISPTGAVVGAEALVRWRHPELGLLAPNEFFPVAERGDLLRELDRWVLRTALREAASWPEPWGEPLTIAVNLRSLLPGDPDFVETITDFVVAAGISWHRIVLELVETALCDLPARSRIAMSELVEHGVRFAVDDFGTGYSSLARLKDLPAQIIKVDRRFVAGLGLDPSDFAVARAISVMAHAMGRTCIAEGVETRTQLKQLTDVEVDGYQGWLFAPAMPEPEFRELLVTGRLEPKNG